MRNNTQKAASTPVLTALPPRTVPVWERAGRPEERSTRKRRLGLRNPAAGHSPANSRKGREPGSVRAISVSLSNTSSASPVRVCLREDKCQPLDHRVPTPRLALGKELLPLLVTPGLREEFSAEKTCSECLQACEIPKSALFKGRGVSPPPRELRQGGGIQNLQEGPGQESGLWSDLVMDTRTCTGPRLSLQHTPHLLLPFQ